MALFNEGELLAQNFTCCVFADLPGNSLHSYFWFYKRLKVGFFILGGGGYASASYTFVCIFLHSHFIWKLPLILSPFLRRAKQFWCSSNKVVDSRCDSRWKKPSLLGRDWWFLPLQFNVLWQWLRSTVLWELHAWKTASHQRIISHFKAIIQTSSRLLTSFWMPV